MDTPTSSSLPFVSPSESGHSMSVDEQKKVWASFKKLVSSWKSMTAEHLTMVSSYIYLYENTDFLACCQHHLEQLKKFHQEPLASIIRSQSRIDQEISQELFDWFNLYHMSELASFDFIKDSMAFLSQIDDVLHEVYKATFEVMSVDFSLRDTTIDGFSGARSERDILIMLQLHGPDLCPWQLGRLLQQWAWIQHCDGKSIDILDRAHHMGLSLQALTWVDICLSNRKFTRDLAHIEGNFFSSLA